MADHAPNPVEQLLQRYAQQRREQAGGPFELHPADRRQLQDEVARVYGPGKRPEARRGFAGWLGVLPRFGMALGVFAILGLILAALWYDSKSPGSHQRFANNTAAPKQSPPPAEPAKGEPAATVTPDAGVEAAKAAPRTLAEPVLARGMGERPATATAPLRAARSADGPPPPPPPVIPKPMVADSALDNAARRATRADVDATAIKSAEQPRLEAAAPAARATPEKAVTVQRVGAIAPAPAPPPSAAPALPTESKFHYADQPAAARGITDYYLAFAKDTAEKIPDTAPDGTAGNLAARKTMPALEVEMARGAAQNAKLAAVADGTTAKRQRYGIVAGWLTTNQVRADNFTDRALLAAFEVEVVGDRIRLIDTDGSVYEGVLEPRTTVAVAPQQAPTVAMRAAPPAMARSVGAAGGGGYGETRPAMAPAPGLGGGREAQTVPGQMSFQASGTSRRLGQPVLINGTWIALTNAPPAGERQQETRDRSKAATGQAPSAATVTHKISGFLRVGSGPERPLNAVPVEK